MGPADGLAWTRARMYGAVVEEASCLTLPSLSHLHCVLPLGGGASEGRGRKPHQGMCFCLAYNLVTLFSYTYVIGVEDELPSLHTNDDPRPVGDDPGCGNTRLFMLLRVDFL